MRQDTVSLLCLTQGNAPALFSKMFASSDHASMPTSLPCNTQNTRSSSIEKLCQLRTLRRRDTTPGEYKPPALPCQQQKNRRFAGFLRVSRPGKIPGSVFPEFYTSTASLNFTQTSGRPSKNLRHTTHNRPPIQPAPPPITPSHKSFHKINLQTKYESIFPARCNSGCMAPDAAYELHLPNSGHIFRSHASSELAFPEMENPSIATEHSEVRNLPETSQMRDMQQMHELQCVTNMASLRRITAFLPFAGPGGTEGAIQLFTRAVPLPGAGSDRNFHRPLAAPGAWHPVTYAWRLKSALLPLLQTIPASYYHPRNICITALTIRPNSDLQQSRKLHRKMLTSIRVTLFTKRCYVNHYHSKVHGTCMAAATGFLLQGAWHLDGSI